MPTSFLIDREGMLRRRHVGFLLGKRADYETEIRQLLLESTAASVTAIPK